MKLKIKRTGIYICLTCFGAFSLATTPSLKADDEEDFLPSGKARKVLQVVMKNRLNFQSDHPLSAEQKTQIKSILETHRSEIRDQVKNARSARMAFKEAAESDPESIETQAAADAIATSAKNRALLRAKIRSKVWPLLTAEQQQFTKQARKDVEAEVDTLINASE